MTMEVDAQRFANNINSGKWIRCKLYDADYYVTARGGTRGRVIRKYARLLELTRRREAVMAARDKL